MTDQLIIGGGQQVLHAAVLGKVDAPAQVLDAHAHGKFARLHGKAAPFQHCKGVAAAVADGEDELARLDKFRIARTSIRELRPA